MTTQADSDLLGLFLVQGQSGFSRMWRNAVLRPMQTRMQMPGIGPSEKYAIRQFIDRMILLEPDIEDEYNLWAAGLDAKASTSTEQVKLTHWIRGRWNQMAGDMAGIDAGLVDNLAVNDFSSSISVILDLFSSQAQEIDARNQQLEETFNQYVGAFENMAANPSLDKAAQDEARLLTIALKNAIPNLTRQYQSLLTTPDGFLSPIALSADQFLDTTLPNIIRNSTFGTGMSANVQQGNAGASVSAILEGINLRAQERVVTEEKQAQARIDTAIKEMKRLYPEVAGVVDSVLGDLKSLQAEAAEMGVSLEDLVEQKTKMIGRVGEQDRQLKMEGYDVDFRRRLAEIEAQAGQAGEEIKGELSSLESAYSTELRRAQFESEQERTGVVNKATLAERDLTITARNDMRLADERFKASLEALSKEEEEAVKEAIRGIGPGGARREREAEVRKKFTERQKELTKAFEKERDTLDRSLDLALRESEVTSKDTLSEAERKSFEATEAKRAEFEKKATAIEKSLIEKIKVLREKEEEARRKNEEEKVAELKRQQAALLDAIKENEAKLRAEREAAAEAQKKAAEEAAKKAQPTTTVTPPTPDSPFIGNGAPPPPPPPDFRPGAAGQTPPPTPAAPAPVVVPVAPTANPFEVALRNAGVTEDRIKTLLGRG